MHKVLIADDEVDIVNGLAMSLAREGYKTLKAFDGNTALKLAKEENPHLMILDVNMPDINGFSVCQALRAREANTRIIMLSARTEEVDRIVGLEIGADDYMTKPFNLRLLLATVRARLRYNEPFAGEFIPYFTFDDVSIDFNARKATRKQKALDLTERELDILQLLIRHRGQTVTREKIMDKIWGLNACATARTVDNHILRIRKKIEPKLANPRYLLSVYGGGYKFVG